MKISVIIPTYNRASLVSRAIDSVLHQTFEPDEIIVVNDGSTDSTHGVLGAYGENIRIIHTENRGVSHARNIGIKHSKGDWVAFLDSDDEWVQTKLSMQAQSVEANPGIKFCHSNEVWIRHGKQINPMKKHQKTGGNIFQDQLDRCIISPSTVLMRKNIFEKVGLFDEALPICEDYDMWLKVTAQFQVLFVEEPLVIKYGGHEDQLSLNTNNIESFRIKALMNLIDEIPLDYVQEKSAIETLLYKLKIYLTGAKKRGHVDKITQIQKWINHYTKHLNHLSEHNHFFK